MTSQLSRFDRVTHDLACNFSLTTYLPFTSYKHQLNFAVSRRHGRFYLRSNVPFAIDGVCELAGASKLHTLCISTFLRPSTPLAAMSIELKSFADCLLGYAG